MPIGLDRDGYCACEPDPWPPDDPDFGEEATHWWRTCEWCGTEWWSLHCPHDGAQGRCPECRKRPTWVPG